jgi:hypothetical protein
MKYKSRANNLVAALKERGIDVSADFLLQSKQVFDPELVIARYNEDISWIDRLSCKRTIYNKGASCGRECYTLPNIGRESHTYLHHIINNYDNLSDLTIFTQGDPFPHCRDFISKVQLIIEGGLDKPFRTLCDWLLQIQELKCEYWPYDCWPNLVPEVAHSLFGEEFNRPIWFGAGAIFAVTKEAVYQHDLEFYQKAQEFHDTNNDGYAHAFERLWPTIFGE